MTNNSELGKLLSAYVTLKQKMKALEEQEHELRDMIQATAQDTCKEEYDSGRPVTVIYGSKAFTLQNQFVVSNRFDTKQFKQDHTELYKQYCVSSGTTRFSVK